MRENTHAVVKADNTLLEGVGRPTHPAVVSRTHDVTIRVGTAGDLAFLDALQRDNTRAVGFLPTAALVGKLRLKEVLIAEVGGEKVGYLIANDRYQKRDEVGYVTQVNVRPEWRRSLVAGQLLQAQFDRSAWGCRLYSCWCAQDLPANEFWEAMGFSAIAFRTGSRTRGAKGRPRMHIFWQKKIRGVEDTVSWWYPWQTGGGVLRQDRLVFPIPPGMGWQEEFPAVLPHDPQAEREAAAARKRRINAPVLAPGPPRYAPDFRLPYWEPCNVLVGPTPAEVKAEKARRRREERAKEVMDPKLAELARRMRDAWAEGAALSLPGGVGRYDVRRLTGPETYQVRVVGGSSSASDVAA